jgi:hypothetical protein
VNKNESERRERKEEEEEGRETRQFQQNLSPLSSVLCKKAPFSRFPSTIYTHYTHTYTHTHTAVDTENIVVRLSEDLKRGEREETVSLR